MLISRYIFCVIANLTSPAPNAPADAPPAATDWVKHVVDPGTKPAVTPAESGLVDHIIAVHGGAKPNVR